MAETSALGKARRATFGEAGRSSCGNAGSSAFSTPSLELRRRQRPRVVLKFLPERLDCRAVPLFGDPGKELTEVIEESGLGLFHE